LEYDSLDILYTRIAHLNLSSFTFGIWPNRPQQKKTSLWKDEKGLVSLFSTLYDFTLLSNLTLDIPAFGISTKELKSLSLALRGMHQLSSFSLELSKFDPDRRFQGLRSLLSSLKEIPKLASFGLICKGEELCDEEVELITSNLGEYKKPLETLELSFCQTRNLGNKSLLAMQNGLRNLLSLKSLTLLFGPRNIFDKKTGFELLEVLSLLRNLEEIKLGFPSRNMPSNFDSLLNKLGVIGI